MISPWEYRHLRGWARVRTAAGLVLAVLGIVTLSFGGNDRKTYGWTMAFLAAAAADLAFAYWETRIARSEDSRGSARLDRSDTTRGGCGRVTGQRRPGLRGGQLGSLLT